MACRVEEIDPVRRLLRGHRVGDGRNGKCLRVSPNRIERVRGETGLLTVCTRRWASKRGAGHRIYAYGVGPRSPGVPSRSGGAIAATCPMVTGRQFRVAIMGSGKPKGSPGSVQFTAALDKPIFALGWTVRVDRSTMSLWRERVCGVISNVGRYTW